MAAPRATKKQKEKEKKTDRTIIGKGMSLPRGKAEKLSKKPGMSSVGKWKDVPKKDFAGPDGTFPIFDLAHARNALARSHYAKDPEAIRRKVFKKYPELKKGSDFKPSGSRKAGKSHKKK